MRIEKRIKRIIKNSSNVFVVGHKCLDLDAIGACIGIKAISDAFGKTCYIVVDDTEHELSITKVFNELADNINIIDSNNVNDLYKKNSVLVIVDTNKTNMVQNDKILHYFKNIIVIDHHQETDQTINGINIIDITKSSACEMVTNLMEIYNIKPNKQDATIVLSGIVLDTHNYTKKTNENTYYASYYLTACGADPKKVQYYLKEELKDYIIRNKVIMNVEVINDKYAIADGNSKEKYKREDLAKIANTLLDFEGIEAAFVLGNRIDGGVGLSARSNGNINVGEIAELVGGGGDITSAASFVKDMTLKEMKEELVSVLSKEE